MLESIAANLVTNALVFLWQKNKGKFSGSKNDFERELTKIIYESLEAYEKTVTEPLKAGIPFYRSQVFMNELLTFRFSEPFRIEKVRNSIESDSRIICPSQEELMSFFEIFDVNLKKSEQLRILYVDDNYKEEVFRISELLNSQFEKVLKRLDDVNSAVTKFQALIIARSGGPQLFNTETSHEDILQELKAGSSALLSWQNKLGKTDIYIEREETRKLLNWLFEPLRNDAKGIAVLHGTPGIGKTVIMRDVCEVLQSKNVPTLGIRSDLYQAKGFESLKSSLNFSQSIIDTIKYLARNHKLVVILLDQLDALSQSFSGNSLFLDTYNQLIWRLTDIQNVRVVISSRTYDLYSDPTLKEYTKSSSFEVLPLREEQVKGYLNRLSISSSKLSQDFLQILRVPNHLNVFFRIFHGSKNLDQLKTLSDLYRVLWEEFLEKIHTDKEEKITILISELTAKMNLEQRLTVPVSDLIFYMKKGLRKKLVSGGILIEKDEKVQFFHQTFYEYFFARQFVLSNSNLKGFILENHQGLSCRAAVKLILQFYRSSNLEEYIKWLRTLIFDNEIRFHFKYLALSILADQADPSKKERQFLVSDILPHPRFGGLFFKLRKSRNWKLFFLESEIANALAFPNDKLSNTFEIHISSENGRGEIENSRRYLLAILAELIKTDPKPVLKFLKSVSEFDGKPDFVSRILYFLKDWSISESVELYEKHESKIKQDSFRFFTMLENALDFRLEWVFKEIQPFLIDEKGFKVKYNQDVGFPFRSTRLTDNLFEKNKQKAFFFYIETLEKILANENTTESDYKSSYLLDEDTFYAGNVPETIYQKLIQEIRGYGKNDPKTFRTIFQRYLKTKWAHILQILLNGVLSDPLKYVTETVDAFKYIHSKKGFSNYSLEKVQYLLRQILSENVVSFSKEEWNILKNILFSFSNDNNLYLIKDVNSGKVKIQNYLDYDLMKYLQVVPEEVLKKDDEVWKKFCELKRKYEEIKDRNSGWKIKAVPPPLPESAYERMAIKNWKNSFKRYDKNSVECSQHKDQFKLHVSANPGKFLPLVKELIEDESFYSIYVLAGLEGLSDGKIQKEIFVELFIKAINRKIDEDYHLRSYIYLIRFFSNKEPLDSRLYKWLEKIIVEKVPDNILKLFDQEVSIDFISELKIQVIKEWMYLQWLKRKEDGIFKLIRRGIKLNDQGFRIAVMESLPHLFHLNKSESLNLFVTLLENKSNELINKSLRSLSHVVWVDFDKLLPFIKEIYQKPEVQPMLAEILALQWIEGKDAAMPLLKEITEKNEKAVSKIPEICIYKIKQNSSLFFERSKILFEGYSKNSSIEISRAYDMALLKLEQEDFQNVKPLLIAYKSSFVANKIPSSFFTYLHKCVSRYPKEVIELMDFWEQYDNPDIFSEGYDRGEPIQILIAIYRHLSKEVISDNIRLNKVLDMIDAMLENPNLMGTSLETIEKFEIG